MHVYVGQWQPRSRSPLPIKVLHSTWAVAYCEHKMESIVSINFSFSVHGLSHQELADLWQHVQNAEIFTLTYGSLVRQLITDLDNIDDVNKQLNTMCDLPSLFQPIRMGWAMKSSFGFSCRGYNIGIRLIDEYLSKSKTTKCVDFHETAEKIAKVRAFHFNSRGSALFLPVRGKWMMKCFRLAWRCFWTQQPR